MRFMLFARTVVSSGPFFTFYEIRTEEMRTDRENDDKLLMGKNFTGISLVYLMSKVQEQYFEHMMPRVTSVHEFIRKKKNMLVLI